MMSRWDPAYRWLKWSHVRHATMWMHGWQICTVQSAERWPQTIIAARSKMWSLPSDEWEFDNVYLAPAEGSSIRLILTVLSCSLLLVKKRYCRRVSPTRLRGTCLTTSHQSLWPFWITLDCTPMRLSLQRKRRWDRGRRRVGVGLWRELVHK